MLYGAETWATTKRQESRIEVNEMRMLRWMCGVTRKDKIRNEHIRGTTKVAQASRKITERRLKWYGHVMRMEEDHVVKRVMTKAIPGKRKRGRPKTRWKDVCKRDMQTVGLREGDAGDRAYWKEMINNHSGDPRWREKPEEKKKKKKLQRRVDMSCHFLNGRLCGKYPEFIAVCLRGGRIIVVWKKKSNRVSHCLMAILEQPSRADLGSGIDAVKCRFGR